MPVRLPQLSAQAVRTRRLGESFEMREYSADLENPIVVRRCHCSPSRMVAVRAPGPAAPVDKLKRLVRN